MIYAVMLSNCADEIRYDMTVKAIQSTLSQGGVELTVVETQDLKSKPYYRLRDFKDVNLIIPGTPFGYNSYLQKGLRHRSDTATSILILNNDTVWATDDALKGLESELNGNIRSVSPIDPRIEKHVRSEGYRTYYQICGWAILFDATILDEVPPEKLFDSRLKFWYQDNLYGAWLRKIGARHLLSDKGKLFHFESKSHDLAHASFFEKQKPIYDSLIKEYDLA